jgi:chemotaxis signal transduction protein
MIPVVALRKRLGFSGEPAGGRIVVCFSGDDRCGFLVDEVKGVVRVGKGAYQKMALGAEEGRMFLKGLVRWEGILFGELDLHKVLESDE